MIDFDFTADHILEDEIALLRPLKEGDIAHLLSFANQSEIWRFSTQKGDTEEALKKYLLLAIEARNDKKEYPFVIIDKRTNTYAGCTRFYDMKVNQHNLSFGYTWYGKQFHGTGLNKHCKYLLFDFAFNSGFERVEFAADTTNTRSIAAMKSVGCTEEGILRSHVVRLDGSRRDTIVLSMLKQEWEHSLREKLNSKL
ncbi:GNAT family N-acetyltransferase [Pedobacter foliorum]|uniref:GNAT family N-acetyltransferase n=1 Tax=Pedobacter foliorum TaxID=2739058 RepID=UPI00156576C4|nr:GNAT family N-acetyltransferase [Pedobacter foliorum]NRF38397.1 GNAT family N-acetyltransferase [Pedobacter foliorum]